MAASQKVSAQANCHFHNEPFFGYTCDLHDALVEEDNFNLVVNTDNHIGSNTDASVTSLAIGNNTALRFFPSSILAQFPNIRYLFLERAGIENLTPGSLNGCNNVAVAQIRHNSFPTVPAGLFDDCESLTLLDLSDNRITEIDENAFIHIPQLLELDINGNQITRIQSGLFHHHEELEVLSMRNNIIEEIEANAFVNLFRLSTLHLSDNHITEITAEMFGEEIDLVTFNLQSNRLTSVPRLPDFAPRIHNLFLGHNMISEILDDDFTYSYHNITHIDLSHNYLTTLSGHSFRFLESLDILNVGFNHIESLDFEFFGQVPSLYTFYFDYNVCADARFDNIRSRDQTGHIEATFDVCYYHFIEPETTYTCNFVQDVNFGYTCEVSGITFQTFRDKFDFSGNHLASELENSHVTGLRIVNSNIVRVPPSIFAIFPNMQFLSITDSQLEIIQENTFESCGLIRFLDLSRNRIRRLSRESFHNCYRVTELILDDNRISEIEPCNGFLYNVYQAHLLSMRGNICTDRVFETSGRLFDDYSHLVTEFFNRCYSMWYIFLDSQLSANK